MNNELIRIYKILKDEDYHTALEIAHTLNISDRTCRKYIKELNEILNKKGINIISKSRYGYILEGNILNENEIFEINDNDLPITVEERYIYIIEKFINSNDFIKLEDISDEIFVSTKTLSLDIRKIEEELIKYNIKLERKPYYGLKITSSEINIRNLLIDIYEKKLNENIAIKKHSKFSIQSIAKVVNEFLKTYQVKISDISLQNLIVAIYVTFLRADKNRKIKVLNVEDSKLFNSKLNHIVKCIELISNNLNLNINLDENDIKYITIHFLTNETMTYKSLHREDVNEIHKLIDEIFFYTKVTFRIDFRGDLELYKNLYTHLLALTIRLRFGIKIKNPILEDIKKNMPYEFNLATYICKLISDRYGKVNLSESEIGYIAIILHMGIAINKKNTKKNILMICPSGRGVSKFLIYTFNNLFSEYINNIHSCSLNELENIELSKYDVIFTLIDFDKKVKIPVYRINYFLNDDDIIKIKNILKNEKNYLESIFLESQFIYIEKKSTKEEIIEIMSKTMQKLDNIPIDIEYMINEREKLGHTEISKDIAIPHPITVIPGVNFISTCLLKHPIKWLEKDVKIVFFLMLDNLNNNNENIYEIISKMFDNNKLIDDIINNPTYEFFVNKLKKLEKSY